MQPSSRGAINCAMAIRIDHFIIPAVTLLTLSLVLASCSKGNRTTKRRRLIPAASSMSDAIHFEYAIYFLPKTSPQIDPPSALKEILANFPEMSFVGELPKAPSSMVVRAYFQRNVKKEYAPPSVKTLEYSGHGLSHDQELALQTSDRAFVFDFAHPRKDVWRALHTADAIVEGVARKTGGILWDEETRESFSPEAWHKRRIASSAAEVPDVTNETTIHMYNNGESLRAITLGMAKMGLPDVVVQSSTWSSERQVGNLINLVCQTLAEGKPISKTGEFRLDIRAIKTASARDPQIKSLKANATGVACLLLGEGKWEEGDPRNRLIELKPDLYLGDDDGTRQESMISSLFGSEDSITAVNHNDELMAASAKAKAKLPELQRAFVAGLEPGEYIEVKAPFNTDSGGREWMWVEVTSWKEGKINGTLENDPAEVSALHAGQRVEVHQEDVFDYIRQFADKRKEGNTTGEIIRKMEAAGDTRPLDVTPTVPECVDD